MRRNSEDVRSGVVGRVRLGGANQEGVVFHWDIGLVYYWDMTNCEPLHRMRGRIWRMFCYFSPLSEPQPFTGGYWHGLRLFRDAHDYAGDLIRRIGELDRTKGKS